MKTGGYVYIMTNKNNSVLYIGVTNSLTRRSGEHNDHQGSYFTQKYFCDKLVYYECFPDIVQAINREKQLKRWHREWKINLIQSRNPNWEDLTNKLIDDPML